MKTAKFVAIDLGATSGRVILATLDGETVDMRTIHRFPTPLLQIGGRYFWNIYSIYDDIVKGLAKVAETGEKIDSIGIDTWGVDFVCVGEDGVLNALPRSYRDPYTNGIPERFFKKMSSEELYNRTGIQIMNFNSVFQLFAQRKEDFRALENADRILFMPDALSYLLTGKMVCEYTILSTSALMNPRKKELDRDILKVCKVKKKRFPKIVLPGKTVGKLTEELAEKTGLGQIPVVAVAGHDTASAVAAVPAENSNFAYLSSGTWSLMGIETPNPIIDTESFSLNFTNEGGVDGTTRFLKNITGMWLLEQCLEQWRKEGKDYSYAEIASMAGGCKPSEGVLDPDDASFAAPTNMPLAICNYCKEKGLPEPQDDAAMIRLIYDSLAAKYAEVFDSLRKISQVPLETLHIIGGGSQNDFLNQMTADACRVKVVAGPAEGTALGNIMIQARAAGLVKDLQSSRDYIRKSIETKTFNPKQQ